MPTPTAMVPPGIGSGRTVIRLVSRCLAVGVILAEAGCSQYEIMSIHGHSDPATSKIYTATVERRKLAEAGLGRLDLGKIMG
jgi:hypothetical protein